MYRRFLSIRYFRTRLVNWLSVAGVMVGVAVMIVVWSVFSGFQVEVKKSIRGTLADIELRPDGKGEPRTEREVDALLESASDVVAWTPRLVQYVAHPYAARATNPLTGTGRMFHFMEAVGIDWDREVAALRAAQERGVRDPTGLPQHIVAPAGAKDPFYNAEAARRVRTTAIFSRAFLDGYARHAGEFSEPPDPAVYVGRVIDMFFVREKRIGEDFEYKQSNLQVYVSAVYDGKDHETDFRRVFFDRKTLWDLIAPIDEQGRRVTEDPPYTSICVTVADYQRSNATRDGVAAHFRERIGDAFEMVTWEDQRAPLLRAVSTEKVLLAIVIAFIGLLAGFTILATLTLTVVEKTKDIGVLMALGATSRGVMSVFLRSGVMIGVLGGLLGLGLGVGLTESLDPINDGLKNHFGIDLFPPDIYMFERIPHVYNLEAMAWIVVGCMATAFLAGLLPSLRAARMDPIVALRHE